MSNFILSRCVLLLLVFTITGCDFDEPISKTPSHEIDPRLLGTWKSQGDDPSDQAIVKIEKKDATHYFITVDSTKDPAMHYEGVMWHNTVGKTDYLTLHLLSMIDVRSAPTKLINLDKTEKTPYDYLTYSLKGNVAKVRFVSENYVERARKASPKASIVEILQKGQRKKDFYRGEAVKYVKTR